MLRLTPAKLLSALRNRLRLRIELRIYSCTAEEIQALPTSSRLGRDHWEDLRSMRTWSYANMTRDAYLAEVEQRRHSGEHHLYSLVENDLLVHYGWLTSRQERAPDAAIGLVFVPPPASAALWDYFTDPVARGRGLYSESLRQCMHDAVAIDGAREVFIYVYADNLISQRAIEKAGFRYRGSLVMERRFFVTRRYATCVSQPLDVRLLSRDTPARVIGSVAALAA
jgi:RimJ/RimL family protein N-acetyltransferase